MPEDRLSKDYISMELTKGFERAPHRSLLYSLGFGKKEMSAPIIGVMHSFSEIVPGHYQLRQIAEAVKAGVWAAGGTPVELTTIGVCDGLAMNHRGMRYSLASRELVADSVEVMAKGHALAGMVLIPNCDKVVPGMIMAAGRLDIPIAMVSGGPMMAGNLGGQAVDLNSVFEAVGKYKIGNMSGEELACLEEQACPGCGSCAGMFTANSMNCLSEALGLALPGNGTIPAVHSHRLILARETGRCIVDLIRKSVTARQILTRESILNALAVDMALGCSTNTVLHLMAIAYEAGVELTLEDFDNVSRKVPQLCKLSPAGVHRIEHLYAAGGIQEVMKKLAAGGHIDDTCLTVSAKTVKENFNSSSVISHPGSPGRVIASLDNPVSHQGGLAILKGSLAPEGAVVKQGAVDPSILKHKGPARVFNGESEL